MIALTALLIGAAWLGSAAHFVYEEDRRSWRALGRQEALLIKYKTHHREMEKHIRRIDTPRRTYHVSMN